MFVDIPVSFEGYDDYCGVGSVSMAMRYFEQEFLSKQVAPLIILRYLVPGDISKRMCGEGVENIRCNEPLYVNIHVSTQSRVEKSHATVLSRIEEKTKRKKKENKSERRIVVLYRLTRNETLKRE